MLLINLAGALCGDSAVFLVLFLSRFDFPASGQAVVSGVVSSPRYVP